MFVNNETTGARLNIDRFRITHKKDIPIINRLLERRLIVAEREWYRLTLDGIYAADDPGPRDLINSFNTILPVLASMYERAGRSKEWTVREVVEVVGRAQGWPKTLVEDAVGRALWYILPDVPITAGLKPGGSGELATFHLAEEVLNFEPLPLVKNLSVSDSVAEDTFARFLQAVLAQDSQLGLGRSIELLNVANAAGMKLEVARACLERLVDKGLHHQRDGERFLIDQDRVKFALTEIVQADAHDADTLEGTDHFARSQVMQKDPHNVFVVHGRNEVARVAVFDLLRCVGLNPMEWEQARRLTGKASPYVGEILDAVFANAQAIVVLLTGDDEARLREELRSASEASYEVNLTPQARPNVLFEAGMALGRQPDRTLLIELGDLRPLSDVTGRHTVRLRDGGVEERQKIVQRLKDAGCPVVTEGSDWLKRPFFDAVLAALPESAGVASAEVSSLPAATPSPSGQSPPPDIRVNVGRGTIVTKKKRPLDVLKVTVENHSAVDFFLQSVGLSCEDGSSLFPNSDVVTGAWNGPQKIEPGNSYAFHLTTANIFEKAGSRRLMHAVALDKIRREFRSADGELERALKQLPIA